MNDLSWLPIFFVLGLIVGSFLNVVIYRIKTAESIISGRSKCPKCHAKIRWYDNIPLFSFVLLRSRCRDCQEKISWQYPLVEFSTAIFFSISGLIFFDAGNYFSWLETIYWMFVSSIFIVIFVYDLLYMEIPAILLWIGMAAAVVFNLVFDWHQGSFSAGVFDVRTYSGMLGGILSFVFFFSLAYGSKEKWMGMGDAYLGLFLGLVLGASGVLLALIIGFFLGAVAGVILILTGKKKMKSRLPLAPFLILGSFLSLFFYGDITSWYWNLLNF